jgi:alkanesulfonate monooxygenase
MNATARDNALLAPRFGVWAPYRGKWVIDPRTERLDASFDLAREVTLSAERSGFDTILFAQHTINPLDQNEEILEAWTAAAAAAALTERIEIIAAIKPRLYHPVVLAKMALGIEDISRGRFAINLVNAWFMPELVKSGIGFPEHDDRYAYGEEWLRLVRDLISGENVTHHGANFHVDDYTLRPASRFRKRPFIYTGGESEPGKALANALADCWLINGRPIDDVAPLVADLARRPREGARLDYGITGFSLTRATESEAQEALAGLYAIQDSFYDTRRAAMQKNIDPKVVALKVASQYPGARMIGANGGTLPGFVGSYDNVARWIADFYDIGVTTFLLSFFPLLEEQERFAAEIIPRVRALVSERPPATKLAVGS